jgi:hypothetical protein
MWFRWANPFDIITAFRKVGITGNKLRPDLIDQSEFLIDATEPAEAGPSSPLRSVTVEDAAATPPGMVSGTPEALQAQLQRVTELAEYLQEKVKAGYDPVAAGLLQPERIKPPERRGTHSRLSDKPGSFTLRNMAGDKREREEDAERHRAEVEQRKQAMASRMQQQRAAAAEQLQLFEACESACVCGIDPCPFLRWRRCPQCGPKPSVCKVRACVQKRREQGEGARDAIDDEGVGEVEGEA